MEDPTLPSSEFEHIIDIKKCVPPMLCEIFTLESDCDPSVGIKYYKWDSSKTYSQSMRSNIVNENIRVSFTSDFWGGENKEFAKLENMILKRAIKQYDEEDSSNHYDNAHLSNRTAIKYTPGSFFKKHCDISDAVDSLATVLLIPPKCHFPHTGGELILYTKEKKLIVVADDKLWTCCVMGYDVPHEISHVLSGTRMVYKFKLIYKKIRKMTKQITEKFHVSKEYHVPIPYPTTPDMDFGLPVYNHNLIIQNSMTKYILNEVLEKYGSEYDIFIYNDSFLDSYIDGQINCIYDEVGKFSHDVYEYNDEEGYDFEGKEYFVTCLRFVKKTTV
jgi:hypothetical protein